MQLYSKKLKNTQDSRVIVFSLLAGCVTVPFWPSFFNNAFIFLVFLLTYVCVEIHPAKGRADLHIKGGRYRYIFAVKVVKDRDKADEAFEEGKAQFLDRKYADLIEPLTIVPCVMVIVNEPHRDEKQFAFAAAGGVRLEELSLTQEQLDKLKDL